MHGLTSTRTVSRDRPRSKWSVALMLLITGLALQPIHTAFASASAPLTGSASGTDLSQARQLLHEGKYAEAYDLLSPVADANRDDVAFDYVFGRAALGAGHAEQARELFQASLAAQPDSPPAHLALGRAYYALGRYAEAKIEFETVLHFDNLPPDLLSQVRIYNEVARQSVEEERRLTAFGYAETGIGVYDVHDTIGTQTFGGSDRKDTFYNLRVGGGLNYALDDGYALSGTLDYRFRYFDNNDSRDNADLRWNMAGSRSFGDNNLSAGFRGRVSYRGNGNYRNDAGIYADYLHRLDAANQLSFELLYSRRWYPGEPVVTWTRTTAQGTAGWIHSFMDGRASLNVDGRFGRYVSTTLPDGNSDLYGASATLDFAFTDTVDWGIYYWWEHNAYDQEALHFHPEALDGVILAQRNDNLHEAGTYLTWEFAPSWSLRPSILWLHDKSNADIGFNYSSTEIFVNVRKSF
ncbi:tetratricopeptide repeat protein [Dyella humicola]|uniref:tetratricopeptide repeat protein n=1 Tax=Dyella humicola TaxID=2992126 RepID=UPI00224C9D97|nr:tetratricopeptide repeat protein [Dyella humicola]